jgi:hypothetical protein
MLPDPFDLGMEAAMNPNDILDEKIIDQRGALQRIRRWWRGRRPDKGTIIFGLTGVETVEEIDRIRPLYTFRVEDQSLRRAS